MPKAILVGCFLISAIAVVGAGASTLSAGPAPRSYQDQLVVQPTIRKPYLEGLKGAQRQFLIGYSEKGFRELEHLFLGALSRGYSVAPCCDKEPSHRISLHLATPYYVNIGTTPVLIEKIDMAWPKGFGNPSPHLILNDQLEIEPDASSQSFNLLAEWARERGFN
jgi:hypothetical protein|tara:strand:+ start:249 stop:743 length:495 start_codon:yes stop_codon:yes gene_type:complete